MDSRHRGRWVQVGFTDFPIVPYMNIQQMLCHTIRTHVSYPLNVVYYGTNTSSNFQYLKKKYWLKPESTRVPRGDRNNNYYNWNVLTLLGGMSSREFKLVDLWQQVITPYVGSTHNKYTWSVKVSWHLTIDDLQIKLQKVMLSTNIYTLFTLFIKIQS